jgi:hypothetical protein
MNRSMPALKALLKLCLTLTAALAVASPVSAATINLIASMDGAQANAGAGTGSPGTGTANITLDTTTNSLSWSISWSGLIGAATLMHFHGPALPNQNAGVQVNTGVAGPPVVGNAVISDLQEADLLAGLWYLNLHTSAFGGGEIRGQVMVVPEPGTLALLAGGLGLLVATRRAQRA